jgi:hypothetical protein
MKKKICTNLEVQFGLFIEESRTEKSLVLYFGAAFKSGGAIFLEEKLLAHIGEHVMFETHL